MRFHGDWTTAADEVQRARLVLAGPPLNPAIGDAHYEAAELHRLQGRFDEAERAYAEGSGFGRRPEPGLALLRLAQGRAASAHSMIARALEELPDDPRLLEAAVTIALGRGDAAEARSFVERLQPSAGSGVPTLLEAVTARAEGEVLLAEGEPREALRALRARSACGSSSMRRMTRRVSASRSPGPVARSATTRPPSSRPPPRDASSKRLVRRRRWQTWTAAPAAPATASVRASSRCCTTSPADGPIARSPTSSGSASGPWTGT